MKINTVLAILTTCLLASGSAWAQAPCASKTEGLTNVITTTGQGSGAYAGYWFYDFTLVNKTSSANPLNDGHIDYVVLIDKMYIDETDLLPAPKIVTSPIGWSWKDCQWERYTSSPNDKYNVGPSAGPSSTLTGFRYYYAGILPANPVENVNFLNHVLAVDPTPTGPFVYNKGALKGNFYYTFKDVNVDLPGYGLQSTWFDKPKDDDGIHPNEDVPEVSAVMLGALGLLGPMGFALKRKMHI